MSLFEGLLLGALQGLAEFLPISSSGHLVLAQQLLGMAEPQLTFDVLVHFATILATIFYFRNRLRNLSRNDLKLLTIGTIPAGIVGLFFKDQVESLFASVTFVGFALIVTGVLNVVVDRFLQLPTKNKELTSQSAFIVGLAQAIAVFPGISRSGSTVGAGILQGIDREKAFSFSFLLSIPIVLGATVVEMLDADLNIIQNSGVITGFLTALIVGYYSLKFFHQIVRRNKLELLGYYCLTLGILVLLAKFL